MPALERRLALACCAVAVGAAAVATASCTALTRFDAYTFGDAPADAELPDAGVDAAPPAPTCNADPDCDDADACTEDRCRDARCEHAAVVCADDDDPCTAPSCDVRTGCGWTSLPEGAPCDDASLCTTGERCVEGACTPLLATTCDEDEDPCTQVRCRPQSGTCEPMPRAQGAACDDGDPCTDATVCDAAGRCAGGTRCELRDDGNPCTARRCEVAGCVDAPVPDGTSCDGAAGDPARVCCGGACVSTTSDRAHCGGCGRACDAPALACIDGTCGSCSPSMPCPADDGLSCTGAPTCLPDGRCDYPLLPGACLISGVCHTDGDRDPANECLGCMAFTNPTEWLPLQDFGCDDGLFCTLGDWCELGRCMSGGPVRCEDGNLCTVDVCDEAADTCTNTARADGSTCGARSVCAAGECAPIVGTGSDDPQ